MVNQDLSLLEYYNKELGGTASGPTLLLYNLLYSLRTGSFIICNQLSSSLKAAGDESGVLKFKL